MVEIAEHPDLRAAVDHRAAHRRVLVGERGLEREHVAARAEQPERHTHRLGFHDPTARIALQADQAGVRAVDDHVQPRASAKVRLVAVVEPELGLAVVGDVEVGRQHQRDAGALLRLAIDARRRVGQLLERVDLARQHLVRRRSRRRWCAVQNHCRRVGQGQRRAGERQRGEQHVVGLAARDHQGDRFAVGGGRTHTEVRPDDRGGGVRADDRRQLLGRAQQDVVSERQGLPGRVGQALRGRRGGAGGARGQRPGLHHDGAVRRAQCQSLRDKAADAQPGVGLDRRHRDDRHRGAVPADRPVGRAEVVQRKRAIAALQAEGDVRVGRIDARPEVVEQRPAAAVTMLLDGGD